AFFGAAHPATTNTATANAVFTTSLLQLLKCAERTESFLKSHPPVAGEHISWMRRDRRSADSRLRYRRENERLEALEQLVAELLLVDLAEPDAPRRLHEVLARHRRRAARAGDRGDLLRRVVANR